MRQSSTLRKIRSCLVLTVLTSCLQETPKKDLSKEIIYVVGSDEVQGCMVDADIGRMLSYSRFSGKKG
ncbi:hypothetical protein TSAR_016387 [Trichomalopsis sarcophagae]|uniref:Uncharacterized protein n=1 Tax=Trichomalopsis sarcophagae TaxID=543379 RepID=A0A232FBW5_9HYME|nr:hypothetical protein TSAR_016387 [Trichomalopsis sarcophagae]